ncbi:hypothetical protein PCASD_26028 [Puccinia coronata f. sp. avenae]|uniref:Helitron helicase-like domain-containing protein n=1 Tax=Puccinia coronata f. sp. avenae TaxID=200324 RepID=A0A2N5TL44_9BASI|nr:hypothetical protein PCASD_26028 [Puccinia coronata f. sp. avenae]
MDKKGLAVRHEAKNNEESIKQSADYLIPHQLGKCNRKCIGCRALHWTKEATQADASKAKIMFSLCCQKNKVALPSFDKSAPEFPDKLKGLFDGTDESTLTTSSFSPPLTPNDSHLDSDNFKSLIRKYNNAMSFTSLKTDIDHSVQGQMGITVFRILGALVHQISSIEPFHDEDAGYSQIFVVGDWGTEEAKMRITKAQGKGGGAVKAGGMQESVVLTLMKCLAQHNPYAKLFMTAREVLAKNNALSFKLKGVPRAGCDPKRYNQPTVDEVAAIVQGSGDVIGKRQFLLHQIDGDLRKISNMSSAYLPLRRRGKFSPILSGGALLQELVVDMYVCVKRGCLDFIRNHQLTLKADQHKRLAKNLENQRPSKGKRVILPATFVGSPRCMSQLYHDAMAICRKYRTPSLFITMTANPNWPEVKAVIPEGEKAVDHPMELVRIFRQKVKALMFQIVQMELLGRVLSYVSTIEFQKRGLPHLHLMVTLDPRDRPSTPEEVNLLVLAEIPDKEQELELYASTTEQMLHGPCKGRAFWREGGCNIGFPKPFTPRTVIIDGAYPAYKRRDNGRTVTKGASRFHNGHVVPYNRFLSLMFNCHLNVEIPVNSTAIKYLYKYITKGHDRAYMSVDIADKTEAFVDGRYISPPEGESSPVALSGTEADLP